MQERVIIKVGFGIVDADKTAGFVVQTQRHNRDGFDVQLLENGVIVWMFVFYRLDRLDNNIAVKFKLAFP